MNPETLKVLVALAIECRYELHECNILKRAMTPGQSQDFSIIEQSYLEAQTRYVTLLNALEVCKRAAGRNKNHDAPSKRPQEAATLWKNFALALNVEDKDFDQDRVIKAYSALCESGLWED